MPSPSIYTVGGIVQAGDGLYIPRRADEQLLAYCRDGAFTFVLTPRQMGKSSLMVRTARQLEDDGMRTVIVDLTQIGTQVTAEEWYFGLLDILEDSLSLETDAAAWWVANKDLGMTHRLTRFFESVVVAEVDAPITIFVDEIDTTLSLPFSDDFYAAIRYLYQARVHTPALRRLSFVLIGVATPSDLIDDPKRTPFNIGRRVDLTDFTFDEARPFADGLRVPEDAREEVLRWILVWTGGHPYLTQRLARAVAETDRAGWTRADVGHVVAETFFGEKSEQDNNLQFVRDMMIKRAPDPLAVLTVYREVRRGRRPVPDEEQSVVKSHLKLSGVVRRSDGVLRVRNPIYATVFDLAWVRAHWPANWFRRIPAPVRVLGAALLVTLIAVVVAAVAWGLERQRAAANAIAAAEAVAERRAALDSVRAVVQQSYLADSLRMIAIDSAAASREQRLIADSLRQVALDSAEAAMRQRRVAEEQRQLADELRVVAQTRAAQALQSTERAQQLQDQATQARRRTLGLGLASQAVRQLENGNSQLAALLARQAYFFNAKSRGEYLNEIYDALRGSLAALSSDSASARILPPRHGDWVRAVAYSPDAAVPRIASAGNEGTIFLSLDVSDASYHERGRQEGIVHSLAFSPDGTYLASAGRDRAVRVWRVEEAGASEVVGVGEFPILDVAFGPNGMLLAAADEGGMISLWQTPWAPEPGTPTSGRNLFAASSGGVRGTVPMVLDGGSSPRAARVVLRGHDGPAYSVAFSPDGERLASGGADGRVLLWHTRFESDPQTLGRHDGPVYSVAFSPDGSLVASGGADKLVKVWSTGPASAPVTLRGHDGPVYAVAFSPDSTRLASGSGDHSVRLWEVGRFTTGPILLREHTLWVTDLAFSSDGNRLASAGADRHVRVWNVNAKLLSEEICRVVDADLTNGDWKNYVGDDIPYDEYERCDREP